MGTAASAQVRIDVERASAFVQQHGSAAERALASFGTGKLSAPQALRVVRAHQQSDGGWTSLASEDGIPISTISHTWVALHWLFHLGTTGEALDATLAFLSKSQRGDGSWDEPDAILAFDPPPWMRPGVPATCIWLTSAVARTVQQLDRVQALDFPAALAYLRKGFGAEGFPIYAHTHWMALQIFSCLESPSALDREIAAFCSHKLLTAVRQKTVDPADLAAVIHAASVAGEPARQLRETAAAAFSEAQGADGGWNTSYGAAARPAATVEALHLARWLQHRSQD